MILHCDILGKMNWVSVHPENIAVVFQLSGLLIELKIKYQQTLHPELSEKDITAMVFEKLLSDKMKEHVRAARQKSF